MSEQEWNLLKLLRWTTEFFEQYGLDTPRLDAEVLLAHALGMKRLDLYLAFDQPVSVEDRATFRELVRRRAKDREPVAYLTGTREFWSMSFAVRPGVLIPRPDTETLVRAAIALQPRRVVELGAGSGCVSAALAAELPDAEIVAIEASPEAYAIAQENLEALGHAGRVKLVEQDSLAGLGGGFDLIVSNPPYIASAEVDALSPEVQQEPRLALDGGADGFDVIRQMLAELGECLLRPGHLLLEVGQGQASDVAGLVRDAGAEDVEIIADLAGIDRVVRASFGED